MNRSEMNLIRADLSYVTALVAVLLAHQTDGWMQIVWLFIAGAELLSGMVRRFRA